MTTLLRATSVAVLIVAVWGASVTAQIQRVIPPSLPPLHMPIPPPELLDERVLMRLAQAKPEQQEEFLPIDQLPPQEQLPAGPLLVGAYAFVLLVLFGYLVSVARRLSAIQREVDRLDADVKQIGRG